MSRRRSRRIAGFATTADEAFANVQRGDFAFLQNVETSAGKAVVQDVLQRAAADKDEGMMEHIVQRIGWTCEVVASGCPSIAGLVWQHAHVSTASFTA